MLLALVSIPGKQTAAQLPHGKSILRLSHAVQNLGGLLNDVVLTDNSAVNVEVIFVNHVPIIAVSSPQTLARAILNFTAPDDNGMGIAIQRDDDKEDTVKNLLAVYHAQTEPLVAYYNEWGATGDARAPKYPNVNALASVDAVRDAAIAALRS